jgi:hypothetical protein
MFFLQLTKQQKMHDSNHIVRLYNTWTIHSMFFLHIEVERTLICNTIRYITIMKQISEVEGRQFTSSLNIYPEACCRKEWGAGGVTPCPFLELTMYGSKSLHLATVTHVMFTESRQESYERKVRDEIPLLLGGKKRGFFT